MSTIQNPIDLQALYAKALEEHQQGRPREAIKLYATIVSHVPDAAEVQYNYGLALFETQQLDLAIKAYSQAAKICPEDVDILFNLGLAYKKNKHYGKAEEIYLKALELTPSDIDLCYNLGCCHKDAGEITKAIAVFDKLVNRAPDHLPVLNNLAYLHHLKGNYDLARKGYAQILQLDPEHASAKYMHSVLTGTRPDAPPKEYISSLFDHYSETFEKNLIEDLKYNLYLELRVQFDSIKQKKRICTSGLDLGCGTGLAGEAFRTACIELSGVDLSIKMIEQAAAKQIYDSLYVDDLVTFLHNSSKVYDLFIAADVLMYLGDLHPLFAATAGRSMPDALFCFTTEQTENDEWILQPTGRYAHNPDYVKRVARENGWTEMLSGETTGRREGNSWIKETLFVLTRKA